ncbi:ribosome small subunit-dependent GTPase A [Ilyobacter polytropus DSM 2926]|uniref:Small ribosomal subunit biogenesis GTPase RsgA n=2 Tax=Ilyobacter TaxID=167639 RepID=E3H9X0_ILYPC|nr:ribosome small subunit-dependent GTPase A [Ilyobacter polytropus DSM 2926]
MQGFYYVESQGQTYECRLRGILKKTDRKDNCIVGDIVEFSEDCSITKVFERKNIIHRPLVANIDYIVIQFSAMDPRLDYERINILILNSYYHRIKPVIIINKIDLVEESEIEEIKNNLDYLKALDIDLFFVSTAENIGIEEVKSYIQGHVTAFGGPSGVGKSSILNLLQEGTTLKVGETSRKLKRGKHTTRATTLLPLKEEGFVIDTPGFSSVDLPEISNVQELIDLFPEFDLDEPCKFSNCIHVNEPGCAVKNAVEGGSISKERYEFFLRCYEKLKIERWNKL